MTDTAVSGIAIAAALRAGTRAPSPHNTQPWLFEVRRNEIDVLLDRTRVLGVCDPDGREAALSCGAAVLNIRLALASRDVACAVTVLPEPRRPELLATLRLGSGRRPPERDRRLAAVITTRHTNRRPFTDVPVPSTVRHALIRAASEDNARLLLLDDPARFDAFATLLRRAEHVQSHDPRFAAELARWVRREHHPDGVPAAAGGPRATGEAVLSLREFGGGGDKADREFERQPLVAVVTTPGDTRRDAVRAGQALERVLLTATEAGLQVSFLAQPLEVPRTRADLRALLGGHEYPQIALRLGYGFPGTPTPRRPLPEVLLDQGRGAPP